MIDGRWLVLLSTRKKNYFLLSIAILHYAFGILRFTIARISIKVGTQPPPTFTPSHSKQYPKRGVVKIKKREVNIFRLLQSNAKTVYHRGKRPVTRCPKYHLTTFLTNLHMETQAEVQAKPYKYEISEKSCSRRLGNI